MSVSKNNIRLVSQDLIFFAAFVLASLRATLFFPLFPAVTFNPLGSAWIEIVLWVTVLFFAIIELSRSKRIVSYFNLWVQNKVLILFLFFSGVSMIWSIFFYASLFRWLEFLLATSLAVYFVKSYTLERFFEILLKSGSIFVLISILICLLLPAIGAAAGYPYYGAWRGMFWHKNHFGTFISLFNMLYLFFTIYYYRIDKIQSLFWGLFYVVTLGLVVLSKSATAVIATLILNSAFLLLQIWLIVRRKLKIVHYYIIGGMLLAALIIMFVNLDFLFELLGKDRTLTGRTNLWSYLIENIIAEQPWSGYGFGAFWNMEAYRIEISKKIGWDFQVLIGDNGFLDVLIHVGMIGFFIFFIILLYTFVQAFRYILDNMPNILSFLPIFFLFYALIVNLSFSLFMETEMLTWMIVTQILLGRIRKSHS